MDSNKAEVVASIGTQSYLTMIKWEKGEIITDEPTEKGGSGLYPNPFSLLAASLAGCTLITLRMYIDRKQWNINHIKLSINVDQESENGVTNTTFTKQYQFTPDVSKEQFDRLMIIADKCPVAKTLSGQVKIMNVNHFY